MPDIALTTLNAKYIHAAFGLRYLMANLGPLQSRARIIEFDIHHRPVDAAEALLALNPRIVGLGVYIWNVAPATELVAILKRASPDLLVILGGPEVSYEVQEQPIAQLADYVITGEADLKFAEICGQLLDGRRPELKVVPSEPPEFSRLALPYNLYSPEDIAHRVIYVEASRGCPFTCEFCLSSLDIPVRQAGLAGFLAEMQKLLDRGVRQFKFVDRTFNLNLAASRSILEFFLNRHVPGNFYHFEMIPDRLPAGLREVIAKFPPGALQFEVGIQTFDPAVAERIQRRQDYGRLEDNLRFLRGQTGVHVHADLIAGLPGESLESFGAGFDRLIALRPQEIQVGILKSLRGTPITRHDSEWGMVYNPHPPYEILQNRLINFAAMQKLRRFARYWDLVGNSGNFIETTPLIWGAPGSAAKGNASRTDSMLGEDREPGDAGAFCGFMRWSEWLYAQVGRTEGIALGRLMELVFEYLTRQMGQGRQSVARRLWRDYQRGGRRDIPEFLREFLSETEVSTSTSRAKPRSLKRQARHLG